MLTFELLSTKVFATYLTFALLSSKVKYVAKKVEQELACE